MKKVVNQVPKILEDAKAGELSEESLEYLKTEILNRPKEFFNEQNLSKVYKVFASLTDFVRDALEIEELPSVQKQLDELVETLTSQYNLTLDQVHLLRLLVEQLSASPAYAKAFIEGDFSFLSNAPFSAYGGIDAYLKKLGSISKELFGEIQQSPPLRLMLLS